MKILITGSAGYVGSAVSKYFSKDNIVVNHTRKMFNLLDTIKVQEHLQQEKYDIIIHTAAKCGSRLKQDDANTLYENLKCFYNLYDCRDHYNRLITFGSGAEFITPGTFYGISKRCINDIIKNDPKFISLRIFAVFDENELETRFIKSTIKNYISKNNIIIHQNKYMDFFAMQDLLRVIQFFCHADDSKITNRVIDCCYEQKYMLSDIAEYINNIDAHRCNIVIQQSQQGNNYTGFSTTMPTIKMQGLFKSIQQMYEKIYETSINFTHCND